MTNPNHQRANEILDLIGTHRSIIAQHIHTLIDRATIPTQPDGHRRHASGATIEPTSPQTPEDPNNPETWACDRSDPTGEAVIANTPPDPLAKATRTIAQRLQAVEQELATLAEQTRNLTDPGRVPEPHKWCRSCLRIGACSPRIPQRTVCVWCRNFRSAWKTDPPVELLRRYHEGRRIYDRDIAQALADEKKSA